MRTMLNCSLLSTELVYAACIILCIELCSMCQLYTEAAMGHGLVLRSSSECSFGKVHAGHYLPPGNQVPYGFDSNSTCCFTYGHVTAHNLWKDTAPRKPITLIMHLDRTRMYREDQCEGLQVEKEKKHG